MATLAQLLGHSDQLFAAVKSLCNLDSSVDFSIQNPDADKEMKQAKANILANIEAIKAVVQGPTDFLQQLASQVEILSCLYWLAEFQILACIPPDLDISIKDLAELTEVPQGQLYRIICMTATAGFLRVIPPEMVAHTPLSAQFMASQSLLDAVVFMAETVAPTALRMPSAIQRFRDSRDPSETAYNLDKNASSTFNLACQTNRKLGRQWAAYLRYAAGLHQAEEVVSVLSQLNWSNLGDACIVEVGAQSTAMAQVLAKQYPKLRVIVQMQMNPALPPLPMSIQEGDAQQPITVMYGVGSTAPPTITDAAAYILHLPPGSAGETSCSTIRSLLRAYLGVLRVSGAILLILTTRLLSEPGSVCDAVARTRDLSMLQLANEGEMSLSELLQIIQGVSDSTGRLIVSNDLKAPNGAVLALNVKHVNH